MIRRNILGVIAAVGCAGLAQAQMMFLAEEHLEDLTAQLPGSPVLYDIVGSPSSVVQTKYEIAGKKRVTEVKNFKLSAGKVTEIETIDLTNPDKPTTTVIAFVYDKGGKLQMMSVMDKDTGNVTQEVVWSYNKAGKPQSARSKYETTGYMLDKPGGKYEPLSSTKYLEYAYMPDGAVTKVTSYHAPQYAPYSLSFRKGGAPERTGNNYKYALPGEAKYRMSKHYDLPESCDGIMAGPDGTPVGYQREYSYTTEGWLMQLVTNINGYVDSEGNEIEPAEEEVNYQYETDAKGNWTRVTRISSLTPEVTVIYERDYQY